MTEIPVELQTPSGAVLRGDLRYASEPGSNRAKLPLLIVCHGFKAFKDWGPFPAIGRRFAEAGFASFVFNFSHNGIGREDRRFSEREKFFKNTVSLELKDVETILRSVMAGELGAGVVDVERIGILGHSRGGGVAIVAAREQRSIKAVAGWSTIGRFDRYSSAMKARWRAQGFLGSHSSTSHDPFRVGTPLLDDIEANAERLDLENAVRRLRKPLLLVHGSADLPVPLDEANRLFEVSDKALTTYEVLEGVGHMYGARHPYTHPAPVLDHIIDITANWFTHHL
ncbi:MAG TPA: dienelactone hydrolase family protein [Bacteroidota bacterium]|nr:dienelactone hydrolase family protein [Bacteroidota bacterium]